MANPHLRTPFGQVELRPIASPRGAEGVQTYALLPDLDELLGIAGFGLREPIVIGLRRQQPCGMASSLH